MCGPEDPLFTPLLPLARVPFQAKESVHKTPFWENWEILASTASIFTQILAHSPQILKCSAHKPPNLEIFSSQAPKFGNFPLTSPPFQRQISVRKPHTSEIRAAHTYPKKSWVIPWGHDLEELNCENMTAKWKNTFKFVPRSTTLSKMPQNGQNMRVLCFDHWTLKQDFSRFKPRRAMKLDKCAWNTSKYEKICVLRLEIRSKTGRLLFTSPYRKNYTNNYLNIELKHMLNFHRFSIDWYHESIPNVAQ